VSPCPSVKLPPELVPQGRAVLKCPDDHEIWSIRGAGLLSFRIIVHADGEREIWLGKIRGRSIVRLVEVLQEFMRLFDCSRVVCEPDFPSISRLMKRVGFVEDPDRQVLELLRKE
jgi:hypothetical protein